MGKTRYNLGRVLVLGAALAALSGALQARDPGVNEPGPRGGTAGVGAPGVGVRDPGVNQPGAAGTSEAWPGGASSRPPLSCYLPPGCTTVVIEGTTLQQVVEPTISPLAATTWSSRSSDRTVRAL